MERFHWYESGFRQHAMQFSNAHKDQLNLLPDEIEQTVIQHYNDPVIGSQLRALFAASWSKYRTRTLFNLLYNEWQSGQVRPSSYPISDSIMETDLVGIEAPLLEILQTKRIWQNGYDRQRVIAFMGRRKYKPAVPIFKRLLADSPGNSDSALEMDAALAAMATLPAVKELWWRLAWLRESGCKGDCGKEVSAITNLLAKLPVGIAPNYKQLRALLPATLNAGDGRFLLQYLKSHPDPAAAPDLLNFLSQTELWASTLDLLVDFGSPEIWKRTRAEVERLKQSGTLDQGSYLFAISRLDDYITHPDRYFAEKQRLARQQEFSAKQHALYEQRDNARKLLQSDPVQYVESYAGYLKAAEALISTYADLPWAGVGYRGEIANDYLRLAYFTRFALRQPARAITLYDAASRLGNTGGLSVQPTPINSISMTGQRLLQPTRRCSIIHLRPIPRTTRRSASHARGRNG